MGKVETHYLDLLKTELAGYQVAVCGATTGLKFLRASHVSCSTCQSKGQPID